MFAPDNFYYFIILFTISIFSGTYLLFSYSINRLLLANALVLFIVAFRIAFEFYLPYIDNYDEAIRFISMQGHGVPTNIMLILEWACIWFYVQPLKAWKHKKLGNNLFLYCMLILPFALHCWFMSQGELFQFNPTKIDGYWKFSTQTDFWYYPFYSIHTKLTLFIVVGVLLIGVIRDKKNRLKQGFLLLSYIVFPYLFYSTYGEWSIPEAGVIFLGHNLITSWYLSNYRLFKSNASLITKDVFNSVSDLTIFTKPNFQITTFNKQAARYFETENTSIYDFLKRNIIDSSLDVERLIQQLIDTQEHTTELQLYDREGNEKTMKLKLTPFVKNNEKLMGYTFLFSDLTEIRTQEKILKELIHTKDKLFAIIAHDLRKPALEFRGIQHKVDYLMKANNFELLQKLGSTLEQSALALNNLLDNLLHWANQQLGQLQFQSKPIRLSNAIEDVYEFFEFIAANKNIALVNQTSEETQLLADPNAFAMILRNLVDNALKFTPENGKICIRELLEENSVMIAVQDNGVGIEKTKLKHIFDSTGLQTTHGTNGEAGSGLGLSLVHYFVAQNKGSISVISTPEEGTTFSVCFPRFILQ